MWGREAGSFPTSPIPPRRPLYKELPENLRTTQGLPGRDGQPVARCREAAAGWTAYPDHPELLFPDGVYRLAGGDSDGAEVCFRRLREMKARLADREAAKAPEPSSTRRSRARPNA
jgi:hypothetical protein